MPPGNRLSQARTKLAKGETISRRDAEILLLGIDSDQLARDEILKALSAIDKLQENVQLERISENQGDDSSELRNLDIRLFIRTRRFMDGYRADLLREATRSNPKRLLRHWSEASEQMHKFYQKNRPADNDQEKRAIKLAKQLSINIRFQEALDAVRQKWGITPHLPDFGDIAHKTPDDLLLNKIAENLQSAKSWWYRFQRDFKNTVGDILEGLGGDWDLDYGLIVTALLFAFTAENVLEDAEWAVIWHVARNQPAMSDIEIMVDYPEKFASALFAIAGLSEHIRRLEEMLRNCNMASPSVAPNLNEWVQFARAASTSMGVDTLRADQAISSINGSPKTKPVGKPSLHVRIHLHTPKEHIGHLWPMVRAKKIELWGKSTPPLINDYPTLQSGKVLNELSKAGPYREADDNLKRGSRMEAVRNHDMLVADDLSGEFVTRDALKKRRQRFTRRSKR